ncbi:hypothetical protein QL285_086471 [Trifolium repens]|jgi:hypothetical protein|nr:hypothetical protein QL285_086471 [Trifolium repens]
MEIVVVCYNNEKPNLFRIHVYVTLIDLKHQLSQLSGRLNCHNASRVTGVEYLRSSVCSDGNVLFTNMKLQNDGDVRTMFSIFSQYSTKGLIELYTTLMRSFQDICSSLNRSRTLDEIVACMIKPEDEQDEAAILLDPKSRLC